MKQICETDADEIPLRQSAAAELAGHGRRLLDIGCYSGRFVTLVKNRFAEFYGVDQDPEALKTASLRGIAVSCLDIESVELPYDRGFFDVVVATDIIEHLRDPVRFAVECRRVLAPGGKLILTTPNVRYIYHILRLVLGGRFPRTSSDPSPWDCGHIRHFTFRDIRELLTDAGFVRLEEYNLIDWVNLNLAGELKDCVKSVFGPAVKREFFSSSIISRSYVP